MSKANKLPDDQWVTWQDVRVIESDYEKLLRKVNKARKYKSSVIARYIECQVLKENKLVEALKKATGSKTTASNFDKKVDAILTGDKK